VRPASAKAKGRRLQQHIRDRIRDTFTGLEPDDVMSRSTSAGGEDVPMSPRARALFPFSVEAKNTERLNLRQAWAQACANADGHLPLVVHSANRQPVLATLKLDDLLTILRDLHEFASDERLHHR
jgi:hypothetical protein